MGSLLHPVGSQPPSVYWFRRALVLVAVAVVIGGLAFLFRPAPPAPVAAVPVTTAPTTTAPSTSAPTSTPTVSMSPTPTGPLACDQTNTDLSFAGYQKVKQGGKQPFKVVLSNSGSQNCVLELKPGNFSLTVTSGSDRIWSTEDCAKWVPAKKQTLKPGKSYEFTVEWPLVRSASGCKTAKDVAKPGTYVGKATFATGKEARQVFTVVKK